MGSSPATFTWMLLLSAVIVEVHPRCTWSDMRFPRGSFYTPLPDCGECECQEQGDTYRWNCPANRDCETFPVVLECTYNGGKVDAGLTVPHADQCNNCTCHVGGRLTCTTATCPLPTPARNPVPTCLHRGQRVPIGALFAINGRCHTCECKSTGSMECVDNCPQCLYNNTRLEMGDIVPALDGCNTCECLNEGRMRCGEMLCRPPQCEYEGKVYNAGDTFQQGCNTCDCNFKGQVVCTTQQCATRRVPPSGGQPWNDTCTFNKKRYQLGEEWAWSEGAGPVGPEGLSLDGTGSSCNKCICVKYPDLKVKWVCSSLCPMTTSSSPKRLSAVHTQRKSLGTIIREMLASAFARFSKRNP